MNAAQGTFHIRVRRARPAMRKVDRPEPVALSALHPERRYRMHTIHGSPSSSEGAVVYAGIGAVNASEEHREASHRQGSSDIASNWSLEKAGTPISPPTEVKDY